MDEKYEPGDEITFESGAKIRIKQPSVLAFTAAQRIGLEKDPIPKPPIVHIEAKGRDEENPSDPDYVRAVTDWQMRTGDRVMNVLIMTGTQFLEGGDPDLKPDTEGFTDYMTILGLGDSTNAIERYIQWIKYIACTDVELNALGLQLLRLVGVPESEVAEAIESFRSLTGRDTDTELSTEGNGTDGDKV